MKIAVCGYSGCGKSTLAKHLSDYYGIPLLYLDTVQFEENWIERDRQQALYMVASFMKHSEWVIDGNYISLLQDERLESADYIIYMAFSRLSCLYRAFKRYFQYRNTSRESMAKGCTEKMDLEFIWWIVYKGRTKAKRQYYNRLLQKYKTKATILKNQKQLDRFMLRMLGG